MSDTQTRIAQFRKMASDDPGNELGHFSLGKACLEADMHVEAVAALSRCIELNKNLSKAYQLLGQALLAMGRHDEAIARLSEGVKVADARGDLMPRNEMSRMLADLGVKVAEPAAVGPKAQAGEGEVLCSRCGLVKPKMARAPFSNAQGQQIHSHVCRDCWQEWIRMGTKVINELRLPLSDPGAARVYDQHMMEFLQLK